MPSSFLIVRLSGNQARVQRFSYKPPSRYSCNRGTVLSHGRCAKIRDPDCHAPYLGC